MVRAENLLLTSLASMGVVRYVFSQAVLTKIKNYADNAKTRKKALGIVWIISIILLLMITSILIALSYGIFDNTKPGIVLVTILWAGFFGGTALLFLPERVITACFGGFLGTGLSEIGDASGFLTSLNKLVKSMSIQIGIIVQSQEASVNSFISLNVWLFVGIITLLCLPAFFGKSDS